MSDYVFYMQRWVDGIWENEVDLEQHFQGMKYMRCTGISNKGKVKNIYFENYADSDSPRVFTPSEVLRESTDVEFQFAFLGENRRNVYDSFVSWISGHKIKYWDTFRYREIEIMYTEPVEIGDDDDSMIGDVKYILASFKFKNLKGDSKERK